MHRDSQSIELQMPFRHTKKYRVLKYFPFTSERKAASVLVRDQDGRTFVFVKGADSSMRKMWKNQDDTTAFVD